MPVKFTLCKFVSVVCPSGLCDAVSSPSVGTVGGVVTITTFTGAAAALTLPATSSAVAVMWYVPAVSDVVVMNTGPLFAVAWPTRAPFA